MLLIFYSFKRQTVVIAIYVKLKFKKSAFKFSWEEQTSHATTNQQTLSVSVNITINT